MSSLYRGGLIIASILLMSVSSACDYISDIFEGWSYRLENRANAYAPRGPRPNVYR
jgi:hypothetical protein